MSFLSKLQAAGRVGSPCGRARWAVATGRMCRWVGAVVENEAGQATGGVRTIPGFSTLHGVHHTNRPHRCHLCFRAFGNKAHLRRHLLSHTGEKPFGCPFCERRFSQACNAKVHVANVHSQAKTRSKPAFEYPGAVSFRYAPRSGNGQQRL
ncbi:hypothetical protein HPB47_023228 [Ixodes persulcatus]|uniref:Uncharacterized protein n=1 Tax=Ixodes persulcatus TaxID=34615 RepID=A0AC60Q872_IXOPE|nr:hypothetical protein HPB47_023228 [Ixodes persulcatus]